MNVNIFLPDLTRFKTCGSVKGYVIKITENLLGVYIYDYYLGKPQNKIISSCCAHWSYLNDSSILYGDIVENKSNEKDSKIDSTQCLNYVKLLISKSQITICALKINGDFMHISSTVKNSVIIFYNYDSILKSEYYLNDKNCDENNTTVIKENQFDMLKNIIKFDNHNCIKYKYGSGQESILHYMSKLDFINNTLYSMKPVWSYSNLFVQLYGLINFTKWIAHSFWKERKISVKMGNLLLAMLFDLLGGLLILYWINLWLPTPVNKLFDVIEFIIENMRQLLGWLMGSPAGLKLNLAFNSMLGKFFLYHIDLWWKFLVISKGILQFSLQIFQYLGTMGITFQAAILADLLSLASLHIYCIYTYAARLYNIQMSGLIALWRLFLGRKHNPLRGGVDSCQYSHHQLFIGTLAFTILLFLLPTTALYYIVFTSFRIIFILLGGLLTRLQYSIQSLPLYLLILWIFNSPKIAGDVEISLMEELDSTSKPLMLSVKLKTASLIQLVKTYKPTPIFKPPPIEWGDILSNLWRGKQMYPV